MIICLNFVWLIDFVIVIAIGIKSYAFIHLFGMDIVLQIFETSYDWSL